MTTTSATDLYHSNIITIINIIIIIIKERKRNRTDKKKMMKKERKKERIIRRIVNALSELHKCILHNTVINITSRNTAYSSSSSR